MPRIKDSYYRRCASYVQWIGSPLFPIDESLPDSADGEANAVEAMHAWESRGVGIACSEPRMLDALKKGKQCREFNIKQWIAGVKAKEFWPEEFLGCSGLVSVEEFRSIFGRLPTLPLLRIILRQVEAEIESIGRI